VELTAAPSLGWHFQSWSGDLTGSSNPTTLIIAGTMVVTAHFSKNEYTLTVSTVGSGSVTLNNTGPYHYGNVVKLTAIANVGWSFDHWSGDVSGTVNPVTVIMTGNRVVTATFTQNICTLTVAIDGSGSVTLNDTGPFYYGDSVELTAVPSAGWHFQSWSGNLTGSVNPKAFVFLGNMTVTAVFSTTGIKVYINPPLAQKGQSEIGTTFQVNAAIQNVNDLFGFDFNLTWDNTLITLAGVDFNTSLNKVWGTGNWFTAKNETGPGYYKLVAVSTSSGYTKMGATTIATLTFRVEDPHSPFVTKETPIHYGTHKLSNSTYGSITHAVEDGLYRITGGMPSLLVNPVDQTCRKYGQLFTVQVNVTNAGNAKDFRFQIHYNATLLDVEGVSWGVWGTGTYTADEVNGILSGYTSGAPITGNRILLTITFRATYYHMWKDETTILGWKNIQTGKIFVQWGNLSFLTHPDLRYERGGANNEITVGPDFKYAFSPIQGDIDNNGVVNIFDLRTVAAFYNQQNPTYNLTDDNTIDIYDIVVVSSNFGYTYA
jgi:hypothetical protein